MPTSFLTKVPKIYDGEKTASSTNVAGKNQLTGILGNPPDPKASWKGAESL
jgi:hypothetical protein